jgi:hypothetical protein
MTVSKDGLETFTHHQRNTDVVWTLNSVMSQGRHEDGSRRHSGMPSGCVVDDMPELKALKAGDEAMKLDEAGVPDESNDNEASVGMRKGSDGELTWSSVKGPLQNVASARKLFQTTRR